VLGSIFSECSSSVCSCLGVLSWSMLSGEISPAWLSFSIWVVLGRCFGFLVSYLRAPNCSSLQVLSGVGRGHILVIWLSLYVFCLEYSASSVGCCLLLCLVGGCSGILSCDKWFMMSVLEGCSPIVGGSVLLSVLFVWWREGRGCLCFFSLLWW